MQRRQRASLNTEMLFASLHLLALALFFAAIWHFAEVSVNDLVKLRLTVNRIDMHTAWRRQQSTCFTACSPAVLVNLTHLDADEKCQAAVRVGGPSFGGPDPIFFNLPLVYAVAAFELVTVAGHMFGLSRWAEYSISASIMTCIVAALGRITDAYALVGIFMMTAATMICGHLAERFPAEFWNWFLTGCAFFVCSWAPILVNFQSFVWAIEDDVVRTHFNKLLLSPPYGAAEDGDQPSFIEPLPSWVQWTIWVQFGTFCVFPILMLWERLYPSAVRKLKYALVSFVTKILLLGFLAFGVSREKVSTQTSFCRVDERTTGEERILLLVSVLLAALAFVLAAFVVRRWRNREPAPAKRSGAKVLGYSE